MTYTPYHSDWKDYPDLTTPITAAALEYIEAGIVAASGSGSGFPDAAGNTISEFPAIVVDPNEVDVTGVSDSSGALQDYIDMIDANRGGKIILPNAAKLRLDTGLTCAVQGLELVGSGQTGVSEGIALGSTQFIVGDGQVGLTLGSASVSQFRGYRVSNVHFYEDNAGQALGGLRILNACDGYFDRVACGGFTAGYGIFVEIASDHFPQYNTFVDCRVGACLYGYHQTGAIGTRWIGGQGDGADNGGSRISNSIGFWIESGDSFRAFGTLMAGYDTLCQLGPQIGHQLHGVRCEYWTVQAVLVKGGSPGARSVFLSGSGTNSLAGNLGAGVVIEAGCEDVVDMMTMASTSAASTRHVDYGTRSRFPARVGQTASAALLGTVVGRQAVYDATDTLLGYVPIYDSISGISAPTLVGSTSTDSTGVASVSRTVPVGGIAAGTYLIVSVGYGLGSTPASLAVADTAGNTYTLAAQADKTTNNTPHSAIFTCKMATALAAGNSITFTPATAVNYPIISVYTTSGVATSSWTDDTDAATGNGTTAATPALTTSTDYQLIFACVAYDTAKTLTVASGYTLLDDNGNTGKRMGSFYKIAGASGTETPSTTISGTSDYAISGIGIKKA